MVDWCLTRQIVAKVKEVDPEFQDQLHELERLCTLMAIVKSDLESSLKSDCFRRKFEEAITLEQEELSETFKTSKMRVNYQTSGGHFSDIHWE